jgi:hypothetical protein
MHQRFVFDISFEAHAETCNALLYATCYLLPFASFFAQAVNVILKLAVLHIVLLANSNRTWHHKAAKWTQWWRSAAQPVLVKLSLTYEYM